MKRAASVVLFLLSGALCVGAYQRYEAILDGQRVIEGNLAQLRELAPGLAWDGEPAALPPLLSSEYMQALAAARPEGAREARWAVERVRLESDEVEDDRRTMGSRSRWHSARSSSRCGSGAAIGGCARA